MELNNRKIKNHPREIAIISRTFFKSFYTLSGRTGSELAWHSEGRTFAAVSVQQVL